MAYILQVLYFYDIYILILLLGSRLTINKFPLSFYKIEKWTLRFSFNKGWAETEPRLKILRPESFYPPRPDPRPRVKSPPRPGRGSRPRPTLVVLTLL